MNDFIEATIKKLFIEKGFGEIDEPILPVSGGYLHRMYKVHANGKYYAVKHLNPNIMARVDALENFDRAENLEKIIEDYGLPIAPAIILNGKKRQCVDGNFFYIFNWHCGSITDWNNISPKQCQKAGEILGRIHSIECENKPNEELKLSRIDWQSYIEEAGISVEVGCKSVDEFERNGNEIFRLLTENLELLKYAEDRLNEATKNLPNICCISDEDMDPKNIMWENDAPTVIDLECIDYGNPVSHVLQLSLQWAGITTCNLNIRLMKAFFEGYLDQYDSGFREYDKVFGLAYTWIEWLEYNIDRALGKCTDESERKMGMTEVKNTINRIRYIHDKEQEIKETLKGIKD